MHKRNKNAAIKLLANNMQNNILPINKYTLDLLKQNIGKRESVLLTNRHSRGDTPSKI